MARRLEGIGAAVETERAGEVFFAVGGLRGIYGGEVAGVPGGGAGGGRGAGADRGGADPDRRLGRRRAGRGRRSRRRRLGDFLAPLPTAVAAAARLGEPRARRARTLVDSLERLGIGTLGALRRLGADQVADRFGPLGLRALRIARGEEEPLRPRVPHEDLVEEIELPEGVGGEPARPGARAARRPAAGGAGAERADAARGAARRAALRRRQLERRPGAGPAERGGGGPAPAAGAAARGAARPGRRRCGCGRSASARPPPTSW